jgi:hypothetical protein
MKLHIMCERDVGLFSLIQQVISNACWAIEEGRIPIAYFQDKTCYWKSDGYRGRETVWEYYFEPVVKEYPASRIPQRVRKIIRERHPSPFEIGYFANDRTFVSSHFGDHPALKGKALSIPYLWDDPHGPLRQVASTIIHRFIRPRSYILQKEINFFRQHMEGHYNIGVHMRGTDATSSQEVRAHRHGSLHPQRFVSEIRRLLEVWPAARIFVATDAEDSLALLRSAFGKGVFAYDTVRHEGGDPAGKGPTGWIMPAYIVRGGNCAARNGEDAVVEYLLLSRCDCLIHNGSSLARTVLLNVPHLPHINTHRKERGHAVHPAEPPHRGE